MREPLLPPPSAIIRILRARGYRFLPTTSHHRRMVLTAKTEVSWSIADTDPPFICTDVVHTIRYCTYCTSQLRDFEVMHTDFLGFALRSPHAPCVFLKSPTNSFFLASIEMTGSPAWIAALTKSLMLWNRASRSGWLDPYPGLAVALQAIPKFAHQVANESMTHLVAHFPQLSGEIAADSLSSTIAMTLGRPGSRVRRTSRSAIKVGSVSTLGFAPAPGLRTRLGGIVSPLRNSLSPRCIVLGAIPIALATAAIPP